MKIAKNRDKEHKKQKNVEKQKAKTVKLEVYRVCSLL